MIPTRIWLPGAALLALALAGCHRGGGEASSGAPAAAPPAGGPITLSEFPHRKSGLWRQTMTIEGSPMKAPPTEVCIDDAFEAKASALGSQMNRDKCPDHSYTRNLDGSITFRSTCNLGAGGSKTITSTGTVHGSFDSKYEIDMESTGGGFGAAEANKPHAFKIVGEYLGPCPDGAKGGDMTFIMPGGQKLKFHPQGM